MWGQEGSARRTLGQLTAQSWISHCLLQGYYLNLAKLSVIKGREALPKPPWDQRHDLGILGLWYLGQYWCSQGELLVFQVSFCGYLRIKNRRK